MLTIILILHCKFIPYLMPGMIAKKNVGQVRFIAKDDGVDKCHLLARFIAGGNRGPQTDAGDQIKVHP